MLGAGVGVEVFGSGFEVRVAKEPDKASRLLDDFVEADLYRIAQEEKAILADI